MDAALWVGPAIIAAFIAGLINVVGWFITFRQARKLDRERRAEKVTDVQTALLAEIRSDVQSLARIRVEVELTAIRQLFAAAPAGAPYTPLIPKDAGALIFSAVVSDIAILPTDVIDPVVLYYKQREAIAHFTDDLRANGFAALPDDRKLAMMEDYLRLKAHAAALGHGAASALEGSLGLQSTVSNTASAQLDPKSASAGEAASGQTSSVSDQAEYKSD